MTPAGTTVMVQNGSARRKKQWSELSPGQQRAIVLGGLAELILTTIALRDLRRRPRIQVRGPKALWRLSFVVQPFGPLLYLLIGRR
ncbi:MAG TPA: PLD nuclease N-terminal domain-containing protein [Acidimicrobiia bacterium]|nr:PLD nuclease N-terminal domain-containing protein [Acidimicrobiia bacterium]